ncbi:MAG: histidine kinase [Paenibacillaceae bacterium]|nr:histidine kinase [Paenibacillaceae bacterium]
MNYIILALSVFVFTILIRKSTCRYTWYLLFSVFFLEAAIFFSMMYVARMGKYPYPANILFQLDYEMFLSISRMKIRMDTILRLINIGVALFLFFMVLFARQFVFPYRKRFNLREAAMVLLLAALPVFYIWYNDPLVRLDLYLRLDSNQSGLGTLLRIVDAVNAIWITAYLFLPMGMLVDFYRQTTLQLKRKQILALVCSFFVLNVCCLLLFIFGPFRSIYSFSSGRSLIDLPDLSTMPSYFFTVVPFAMVLMIIVTMAAVIRYKGFDTVDLFRNVLLRRQKFELSDNMRSVFHSFKNTLFTVNILAEQAQETGDAAGREELLRKIQTVTDHSFDSITRMLDSLKNPNLETASCYLVDAVEEALAMMDIPESVRMEKRYRVADVMSTFDMHHITQVIQNIVQNAVDSILMAGIAEGKIEIEVSAEHEWAILRIKDNGVGIKKADQYKIFQSFYTTKSRSTNWGVGLSYAFQVIKAHFGCIVVDSKEQEGTVFQILLLRNKKG